jgi:hypothetical protein
MYLENIVKRFLIVHPHEKCDSNGYYNNMIYPHSHFKILVVTSKLSFFSATYGLYKNVPHLAIVPYSVGITSHLYWKKPIYNCYIRYIDICTVVCGYSYHIYYSFYSDATLLYLFTFIIAASFYPISNMYIRKNSWISVYLYSFLHIFGNISNVILYSSNFTK